MMGHLMSLGTKRRNDQGHQASGTKKGIGKGCIWDVTKIWCSTKNEKYLTNCLMTVCLMLCCIQVACDRMIGSVAYNGGGHGDNISSSLGRQLSHHRITATWAIFCQQLKRGGHQQKKNVCKNVRPPITKVHHQIIAQYLMVDGWYPVRLQCEKSKTRNKKKSMSEVPYLFGHRGFKVWDAWLYIGSRAALCLEIWPQSGAEDMNNKTNLREGG